MRRHLNTLYVTSEGAWISKDGENVVVSVDGAERGRVPMHGIGAIVAFGRVAISAPMMSAAAAAGITMTHMTEEGRFLARIDGPVSGNVLLRRTQYRWADDPARRIAIIKSIVAGKVLNQRAVLNRALRDHAATMTEADTAAVSSAVWTSPGKVEGFSDRMCESGEHSWARRGQRTDARSTTRSGGRRFVFSRRAVERSSR